MLKDKRISCGLLLFVLFSMVADLLPEKSSRSLRNGQKYLNAVKRKVAADGLYPVSVIDELLRDLMEWSHIVPSVLHIKFEMDESGYEIVPPEHGHGLAQGEEVA